MTLIHSRHPLQQLVQRIVLELRSEDTAIQREQIRLVVPCHHCSYYSVDRFTVWNL